MLIYVSVLSAVPAHFRERSDRYSSSIRGSRTFQSHKKKLPVSV